MPIEDKEELQTCWNELNLKCTREVLGFKRLRVIVITTHREYELQLSNFVLSTQMYTLHTCRVLIAWQEVVFRRVSKLIKSHMWKKTSKKAHIHASTASETEFKAESIPKHFVKVSCCLYTHCKETTESFTIEFNLLALFLK